MKVDKYIGLARDLIKKSNNIMILSGAGLSTEAGIPDFRSDGGLYSKKFHGYNPELILSNSFFYNNTDLFYEYLRSHLNYSNIGPDKSYQLLAKIEEEGKIRSLVTQNIDSLHRKAGSKNLIEIHGTLGRFYCDTCHKEYDPSEMMEDGIAYKCNKEGCKGTIRPDVVLYDEEVYLLKNAIMEISSCDLLLVLGTSLRVYPVASIPEFFLAQGKNVIIINRDPTPLSMVKGVIEINNSIGDTLPKIFDVDGINDLDEELE